MPRDVAVQCGVEWVMCFLCPSNLCSLLLLFKSLFCLLLISFRLDAASTVLMLCVFWRSTLETFSRRQCRPPSLYFLEGYPSQLTLASHRHFYDTGYDSEVRAQVHVRSRFAIHVRATKSCACTI